MLTILLLQPQRIRVRGDENAPLAVPDKPIHQQNKSTSALSALLQNNPTKNAPKRAAFGDVSNTANLLRTNRDDSAAVKNANKVPEKPTLLPAEKKHTVLSQPAQRPMSVPGLRDALTGAADQKPTELSGKQMAAPQPLANTRKILNKRDNTVYRDYYLQPSVDAKGPTSKEVIIEAVRDSKGGYTSHSQQASLQSDMPKEGLKDYHYADESSVLKSDGISKGSEPKNDEDDCKVHDEYKVREINSTAPESHESVALSHLSHGQAHAHSEPEEYWDDDDYENDEDDGYITARSYRSRGDNTTGGATTVLFPKYSNQVKRDLALAKEIVEATRTSEDIEDEYWDTSMVAEYNDDIFDYIREQEVGCPSPGFLGYC